ncbi:sensor histidine kinase [Streptacidiphilus sp. N1-10]|uniref:histidine kinase n=1 Tax=Streptacidiphilus jeojiensis TaxID=3229225 RepID=A0ABV6XJR2_9ACTN
MDPLHAPLLKRLTPAHWVAVDCVAVLFLTFLYRTTFRGASGLVGSQVLDSALVTAAMLPAALRRIWPRTVLAVVVVAWVAVMVRSYLPEQPAVAIAFVVYLVPLRFPRRKALLLLIGTVAVTTIGFVAAHPFPNGYGYLGANAVLISGAWLTGLLVRQQRAYSAGMQDLAERRARAMLVEDRLQIARELHDVVAHTLSLIAVQAGVANFVVAERPEEAPRALASIEGISRNALAEMRAMLGVLRADDQGDRLGPAPGLEDLKALVERAAEAGVRVALCVRGSRPHLSAGIDLAAYRVIQEAVTNVIKHAAAGDCRVTVTYADDALALEVTDCGRGMRGNSGIQGPGHGLVGMRERVGMYGGEFEAGPGPERGFRVAARFSLRGSGLTDGSGPLHRSGPSPASGTAA